MSTYSIYQKPCPECGAIVPTDKRFCGCGHRFESSQDEELLPEERMQQEEELFQAYLVARVDQTVAAVESARAELAADPRNLRKTKRLIEVVQEALTLRDQRETQTAKIVQSREAVRVARQNYPETALRQSEVPTDAFRAQQMAKLERIIEEFKNTETKICANCKTKLPVTSALCGCGYVFALREFMLPRAADKSTRGEIYQMKKNSGLSPD